MPQYYQTSTANARPLLIQIDVAVPESCHMTKESLAASSPRAKVFRLLWLPSLSLSYDSLLCFHLESRELERLYSNKRAVLFSERFGSIEPLVLKGIAPFLV